MGGFLFLKSEVIVCLILNKLSCYVFVCYCWQQTVLLTAGLNLGSMAKEIT
jgi:hypothetical protein